ncbi:MAG: hypothetical protein WED83_00240 [Acidimicrobiia bacterium]
MTTSRAVSGKPGSRSSSLVLSLLPWVLLALVLVAWAPGLYYDKYSQDVTNAFDKLWASSFLAFPVVGVFLTRRMPSNPVGWLFLISPALMGAGVSMGEYSEAVDRPGLVPLADGLFVVGLFMLFSSILVFPDGRYPNRWFRWAHVFGILGFFITGVLASEATGAMVAFNFLLPVLALVYRLVRGNAITRRQIVSPVLVALLGFVLIVVVSTREAIPDIYEVFAVMVLTVGIPVSIAVAITRYRLYEIDRIVSRTVSYALVVGLLAAVFFGAIALSTSVLSDESDLATAASTLAVAALFNPLRKRVQVWVDRRFNRSRYDAQRVMDRFAGSLRDQVDTEEVVQGWVGVVSRTMQPTTIAVWSKDDSRNDFGTIKG